MGLLEGKKILVLGVANNKSIAWSVSELFKAQGAELCFTYMNEAIEKRVRPLAEQLGNSLVLPCDVQSDQEIDDLFAELKSRWGTLDGVIHSVAYAEREDLQNPVSQTSRKGFQTALDVSAYSLIALCGRAKSLMTQGGSVITMSYLGAERVVENYNVMGIAKAALESSVRYLAAELGESNVRVNAVSAGPIKTLAASGIPHFKELLNNFAERAPLRRNVEAQDVAKCALFLMSDLGSAITAETVYVDCGFHTLGL